ncbi:claudin 15-like a isoform X2 [Cynoglossus semilaevis]|uniref:claudin 15-like a isoform X2 n=1 Tax=Cynoglossus semilaevis TaxID=244447 RepID=UPI000D62AD5C|nr:claudin-15-like isoform X2 [Cynoglossus semilaevis]
MSGHQVSAGGRSVTTGSAALSWRGAGEGSSLSVWTPRPRRAEVTDHIVMATRVLMMKLLWGGFVEAGCPRRPSNKCAWPCYWSTTRGLGTSGAEDSKQKSNSGPRTKQEVLAVRPGHTDRLVRRILGKQRCVTVSVFRFWSIMSTIVQATGLLMGIVGWLVTGVALANDYWKISAVTGSVIISQRQFENLWHSCAENSAGIAECRDFETLLGLPVHVQACRALMIMALLLGLGAMVVSLLGVKCIRIGSTTDQTKARMAVTGGVLNILSGLLCLTACSWYAYRVVQDFNNPFYVGLKFELGTGLFLGWGGASLSILGGALLCTACSAASGQKKKSEALYGNQPKKVYTAITRSEPESSRAYV